MRNDEDTLFGTNQFDSLRGLFNHSKAIGHGGMNKTAACRLQLVRGTCNFKVATVLEFQSLNRQCWRKLDF